MIDQKNAHAFSQFFAPDGVFVFGNAPALQGRDQIEQGVGHFFTQITALKHDLLEVWNFEDTLIAKIDVTYIRLDGKLVTVPCANIWKYEHDLISDYRIYIDLAPLFSPTPT